MTAKDVRVLKSVRTSGAAYGKQDAFTAGNVASFRLEVDTSEYTDAHGIALTDQLPNGLCPIMSAERWAALVDAHPALATTQGCTAADGQAPQIDNGGSIDYSSVTYDDSTGKFSAAFTPIADIAAQSTVNVTYPVRMLVFYPGGSLAGTDTSAGDAFTDTAVLAATTTPIPGTSESGSVAVSDSSAATLVTGGPTIAKLIEPLPVDPATDYSCAGSGFVDPTNPVLPAARTTFALGDRVCFELRVQFAAGVRTRNPVVTDFLPAGTAYVPGSAQLGPDNTVAADQISLDDSGAAAGTLVWTLGYSQNGVRLIDPGQTFVVRLAVRVTNPADPGKVDLAGNLLKFRQENSSGRAISLRDRVDFSLAPAIPLSLTKGVASVNGLPTPDNPANTDHVQVKGGDLVDFRVDVANLGNSATSTDRAVSDIAIWDVLPAPFTCTDLVPATNTTCRDPGDFGDWNPVTTNRSIVRIAVAGPVAAGATTRLDVQLTVPEVGPSVDLTDTASVSSYTADADDGPAGTTYYPANNPDADIPAAQQLAPAAADSSDVFTAPVAVAKTITSAIAGTGNDGAGQAAIGELMTFTLSTRIPAGLTVNSASLSDVVPSGVELLNAAYPPAAAYAPDAANPTATQPLPDTFTLDPGTGVLTFPASYTNASGTDQLIFVTLTGRFTTAAGAQGSTATNRARFTWTPVGGTPTNLDGSAVATVVEPAPTLAKTVTTGPYSAGQTVTYQLAAADTTGRPTAYDTWVIDCAPAGLTVTGYVVGSPTRGTTDDPTPGTGTGVGGNGCAVGTTRIGWHVGDLASGTSGTLYYTATVSSTAAAGQTYANTASLSSVSIPGTARPTPSSPLPDGARKYTASATRSIKVTTPTLTKAASPTTGNVGTTVTYTVTTVIPASVNLYNAVLRDLLPAGLDATRLASVSLTCTQTPGSCTVPLNTPTTAPSGTSTLATWSLGDLTAQPQARTLTLTYTVPIADVAAASRGAGLTNGAAIEWNTTSGGGLPAFSTADIPAAGKVKVTVTEPIVRVAKSVNDTTPDPAQTFRYTLTASNGAQVGDTNAGPAYSVTVTDAVPTAVIIDPSSLPVGATLSGTNPDGSGGTISWSIAGPLPVGAANAISIGYNGTLAASSGLTGAGLTNTATVTDAYTQPAGGGRHLRPNTTATATVTPQFPKVVPVKAAVTTGLAYAGDPFTWRITLTNTGTARAYALSAIDVLPPHWTYRVGSAQVTVGASAAVQIDPAVTPASGADGPTLTWSGFAPLGADPQSSGLLPGQSVVITFDGIPGADAPTAAGTTAANTNRVTASINDSSGASGNAGGSYATGTGTAVARLAAADIRLAKSAGTFTAGGTGTWTLGVSNSGPDTAAGPFLLTDTIPATVTASGGGTGSPLTLVSAAGTGWSCTVDSGTRQVSCGRTNATDTLASGAGFPAVTVTVAIPPDAAAGATAANSGSVTGRTFDPDTTNNTASATGTVSTEGDLQIGKTLTSGLVAGSTATYSVQVANLGPAVSLASAGQPITVTDTLPAGTTLVSATGDGWNCAPVVGATLTCGWTSTLAVNASANPLVVTVAVPANRTSAVTNTATVSPGATPDHDSRGGANTATVTGTPDQSADLGTAKVLVDKATKPVVAGTVRQYQLSATNYGPSDATGVVLTDTLPTGLTYTGTYSADSGDWTCSLAAGQVRCVLAGSLPGPSGGDPQTRTVTISVRIPAPFDVSKPLVNSVTVSSGTPDPGPMPNTATDNSLAVAQADLSIDKTITTAAVAGRTMAYRLQVHNQGPSDAAGPTVVRDTLPDGLTYDAGDLPTGTGWSCALAGDDPSTVVCTHPGVIGTDDSGDNAAAPINVPVLVDEGTQGPVVNRASVTGPLTDPDPDNNVATVSRPVTEQADVTVTKAARTHTVTAGTDVTFDLTVTDSGPSTARTLSLVDSPDTGLQITGLSGSGWDCDVASRTCTRDTLAVSDGTSTLTVTAHVQSSVPDGSRLVNAVDITVATPHSDATPAWHDQDSVTVNALAAVSLVKTHDTADDPVDAGDPVTFTMTATNAGPSDAVGPVTITDTMPDGMSFLSNAGPWTCSGSSPVSCTLDGPDPRIAAHGTAPALTLVALIDPTTPAGTLTNRADISTGTAQNPDVPTTARDDVPVTTAADLALTKTHTGTATAGDPFTWTMTVTNLGPSTSAAAADSPITVTDTLPEGLTFTTGGGAGFACSAGETAHTVVCTRSTDLPVGGNGVSFPITTTVAPDVTTTLTNTATVAPGLTAEPANPLAAANDDATDSVAVVTDADLSLTKTHPDDEQAIAGDPFTWTLTVDNAGPSTSAASSGSPIVVTDTLPAGVSFLTGDGAGWTCTPQNGTQLVACARTSPLPLGPSTITLTGAIAADNLGNSIAPVIDGRAAPEPLGTLTNTAQITAWTTPDPSVADHTAADVVALGARADLRIVKSHGSGASPAAAAHRDSAPSDGTAVPGQPFSWTLQVSNRGPSVSRADADHPITVTDTLPAGVSYLAATGTGWDCSAAGQLVTCILGTAGDPADLGVGDAAPIDLTVQVGESTTGSLTNTAAVHRGSTDDPDPTDDTSTDTPVPVGPQTDLAITKTHDAATVSIGSPLDFAITVSNLGPSTATGVTMTDTLPAGLSYVEASAPTGWTCHADGQTVTCTLDGGLLPLTTTGGAEQLITVRATVTAAAYPSADNTATVASSTEDPVPGNNTATDPVLVPPVADLGITKKLTGSLVVGTNSTYQLTVTNDGPTTNPGPVTVTDELPTGLTAVSATGGAGAAGATCQLAATVTCTVPGPLPVNGSFSLALTVATGAQAGHTVTNVAKVASAVEDRNPANDTAELTSPVTPVAVLALTKTLRSPTPDAKGALRWDLTVTNNGPSRSEKPFTVVDNLPDSLRYLGVEQAGSDWSCSVAGQVVTCTFTGTLDVSAESTVTVVTSVSSAAGTVIVNSARLTGPSAVIQVADASYSAPPPTTTTPTTTPTTKATSTRSTTSVAPTSTVTQPPTTATSAAPGPLPNTGFDLWPKLLLALLLLAAGAGLLTAGRRRRGHQH